MNIMGFKVDGKVIAAVVAVVIIAVALFPAILPSLFLLLCPLSMVFMMGAMGHGMHSSQTGREQLPDRNTYSQNAEIARLKAEQAALAEKISRLEAGRGPVPGEVEPVAGSSHEHHYRR